MPSPQARAKRVEDSRSTLERDLDQLVDRYADHSVIRDALERMAGMEVPCHAYTTYPASRSDA